MLMGCVTRLDAFARDSLVDLEVERVFSLEI